MEKEEEVVLLDFGLSPFAMRCRIALAEKSVKYKQIEEPFSSVKSDKEGWVWTKSDLLLKMNPINKLVPVLIHREKPVCESTNIVEYIDEVWRDDAPPLLPSDPYLRAQARFWVDFVNRQVYKSGSMIMVTKGKEQEALKKEFIDSLKVLEEQALGDKAYFGGETFGFIDVNLIPYYAWFYTYETYGDFKVEDSCSKLIAWAKRCMQRETVAKSLYDPHRIYDFMEEVKRIRGIE